ncbi:DUF1501 domain-containing protein [Pseudoalteromonas sp. OOF1S-7]|uniref:DUF1501 domain-containing protein n=1 Tax=Pseudoalteromonas sp. OOF1S-7 TaxID=2917757 RepID=UPI001EF6C80E|nr:DUF1501 domain-containing protein [Pseudoalteromonas sp. OOF1S-7]MCG7537372.1 DUF1501 domain-containing protein [Pseudoalteromonas sp. OOF1S-7]
MNRRDFIKLGGASLMASSMFRLGQALANSPAQDSDYKALVCVFLYGGMDNHDTIIPYDDPSYTQWAGHRQSLLGKYTRPRTQANLLPIATPGRFDSRRFALPPELAGLAGLYQQNKVAVVGNVGPLLRPVTASMIAQDTARLPARLFSHNDQQSTWMSGAAEGAQFGWGGLMNDALMTQGLTGNTPFNAITTADGALWLTGKQTAPYHVSDGQAATIEALEEFDHHPELIAHFSNQAQNAQSLLQQDLTNAINSAYEANSQFNAAQANTTVTLPVFPATGLGRQLQTVGKSIAARQQLGASRQVYVVAMGGFDTHSGQAQNLPKLQTTLDSALVAFNNAMESLGLSEQVTLFTASDFGRTLAINGDGTDHGWAGHHFVMGGAVNGGTIFGDIPKSELNHELDAGGGRLIPTTSVDQYAASLGQWMGLDTGTLNGIFPNLVHFNGPLSLFK